MATTKSKTATRSRTAAHSDNNLPVTAAKVGAAVKSTSSALKGIKAMSGATAPASPDFVSELNNIDFRKMIGGPLQAVIDAQVASSLATVNFINNVGFTIDPATSKKELVMVDFSHNRKDVKEDGTATSKEIAVKVPLLAMLPIPSLRIEQATIDFNVKLNSVASASVSDELGIKVDANAGFGPISFKVSASYQRKTSSNVEVKKEYALNVNVKVSQDEIPPGLEKLLNLLSA
jgi:Protein of unknown function (DUF2589)